VKVKVKNNFNIKNNDPQRLARRLALLSPAFSIVATIVGLRFAQRQPTDRLALSKSEFKIKG